jgi:hypothetical protein
VEHAGPEKDGWFGSVTAVMRPDRPVHGVLGAQGVPHTCQRDEEHRLEEKQGSDTGRYMVPDPAWGEAGGAYRVPRVGGEGVAEQDAAHRAQAEGGHEAHQGHAGVEAADAVIGEVHGGP